MVQKLFKKQRITGEIEMKDNTYVRQIITDPKDLASAINKIGYENVLNIIPCNSYDGCIVVILYKEIKNNE